MGALFCSGRINKSCRMDQKWFVSLSSSENTQSAVNYNTPYVISNCAKCKLLDACKKHNQCKSNSWIS